MSEVMYLIPFMSEIMKLNSIHVRNFETNSIYDRKFDFDPHFHGKIYYDNKHGMIKIFNLQGILILNITFLLQDNILGYQQLKACVCDDSVWVMGSLKCPINRFLL